MIVYCSFQTIASLAVRCTAHVQFFISRSYHNFWEISGALLYSIDPSDKPTASQANHVRSSDDTHMYTLDLVPHLSFYQVYK